MTNTVKRIPFFFLLLIMGFGLSAQPLTLNYYLPAINYDPAVENPKDFLGYVPGEWHYSHDQVVYYGKQLAQNSPRVVYKEYARSHENRPLFHLIITHPDNMNRLEQIKQAHQDMTYADKKVDLSNLPAIINLGYNVHGNEQSSVGAAVLIAYYLAAGQSPYLDSLLRNTVVLIDPCLNPDGMNRFSTWVNSHKSKNLVSNPASREFNEPWPGSRTNHYWFDLNRDWLPVVHPESRGRIKAYQEWLPNIVCDYHEMGTNSTYFFQPGVPDRNNPLTPQRTFELTEQIARYHAKYLDELGSLYYSREDFDDFYYGKGSTYPDVNGAIGILFEQASSRGHLQDSKFGPLSYPFTIRNQVYTSFSSLEAAFRMREELLVWKRTFYTSALKDAANHPVKAYVFDAQGDFNKAMQFLDVLGHHNIDVFQTNEVTKASGMEFPRGSFIVPLDQRHHRLIRGIFDTTTEFQDSLFYDVSSWTLPLGMNLKYAPISTAGEVSKIKGGLFELNNVALRPEPVPDAGYAYAMDWNDYFTPAALSLLLDENVQVQYTNKSFKSITNRGEKEFGAGSIIIPLQSQQISQTQLKNILQKIINTYGLPVYAIESGSASNGIDLGSPRIDMFKKPTIAILAGSGMYSNEVGEVWHLLDQKMNMKGIILDVDQFNRANWSEITHLVMVSGNPSLSDGQVGKLKEWVQSGGTIIGLHRGNSWLKSKGFAFLESATNPEKEEEDNARKPYDLVSNDRGSRLISGAIFSTDIDRTHPLFYGYESDQLPVFRRGTDFYKPSKNAYATPAIYSEKALLSGYVHHSLKDQLSGHAAVVVSGVGSGKVISILDNPLFRGYWTGTHKLFMNAIFFGPNISWATVQRN